MKKVLLAIALVWSSVGAAPLSMGFYKEAYNAAKQMSEEGQSQTTYTSPAKGSLEVAFSPDGGSEGLVKKVIDSANKEVLVMAYSFTSAPIVDSLLKAAKRGVIVKVVADKKNNTSQDASGKARAAMSALVNAGVEVRLNGVYPIHHDKVVIADRKTVELGSFNYSAAAQKSNSENVLVVWSDPDLANIYIKHFERNFNEAYPFTTSY